MLPPPARSKQMKGILPAPVVMLHGAHCRLDVRGQRGLRGARIGKHAGSVGAITVAAPVMKPCARNSRRVRGRG